MHLHTHTHVHIPHPMSARLAMIWCTHTYIYAHIAHTYIFLYQNTRIHTYIHTSSTDTCTSVAVVEIPKPVSPQMPVWIRYLWSQQRTIDSTRITQPQDCQAGNLAVQEKGWIRIRSGSQKFCEKCVRHALCGNVERMRSQTFYTWKDVLMA